MEALRPLVVKQTLHVLLLLPSTTIFYYYYLVLFTYCPYKYIINLQCLNLASETTPANLYLAQVNMTGPHFYDFSENQP